MHAQKEATRAFAKLFLIGICALLAVAIFAGFYFYRSGVIREGLPEAARLPVEKQLTGTLYFTLSRSGGNMTAYALKPATGRFVSDEASWAEKASPMYHSFSPDGTRVAFVGIAANDVAAVNGNVAEAVQVRRATLEAGELFPHWRDTERISEGAMAIKQNPSISETGRVLFMGRETFEAGVDSIIAPAEEWSIYLTDETGTTRVVNGTYPKWVSREQFIFFKNDGLYLFNVGNKTEKQIWDTPIPVESNMKLDVSDDRQYVVWTLPDIGLVTIAAVTGSWDDGIPNLELHGELQDVHGFWTVISPDNAFIAVQAVDWDTLQTDPKPRIEFYSLETLEKLEYEVPLREFDQQLMFMTDWVQ